MLKNQIPMSELKNVAETFVTQQIEREETQQSLDVGEYFSKVEYQRRKGNLDIEHKTGKMRATEPVTKVIYNTIQPTEFQNDRQSNLMPPKPEFAQSPLNFYQEQTIERETRNEIRRQLGSGSIFSRL